MPNVYSGEKYGYQSVNYEGELTTGEPTKIASFPYTDFTASTTKTELIVSKFSRNARKRMIVLVNSMDQGVTGVTAFPFDSVTGHDNLTNSKANLSALLATPNEEYYSSDQYPELVFPVDSLRLDFTIGATAPTTGNIDVYLIEVK